MGIVLLASVAGAGLVVDDSLNRYSLYGRKVVQFEHAASSSAGGWIGSDSLVRIDANDTLRSTVTSGKDFQIDNGADWIWGDVRVANDLGGATMYNDSIMGTTYVGRNLTMGDLNLLKGRVYTGGQLTVSAWSHNYYNGSDFFNNSVSTTFSSPFSISGVTWGVQPQATPYSAWVFPDTTFSASSVSIATSFTSPKDASGKYRWTCGSNAQAGGADLVALHICSTNDTILPPGNYGDVNLWYGSTLYLGEGAYSFNNVTLPPSSGTDSTRLLAHQPNGARTVILVKGRLDAQVSGRLNVIAPENYAKGYGTGSDHFAAGTMMIYAERPVTVGAGLDLWATLVVPNHGVTLNDQVHLFGQILADTILVKNKFKGTDGAFVPFHPGQRITFAPVGTQVFGTNPTLSATSSSGLPVSFISSSTGVCTITPGGVLTFATAGTCTIDADQAGHANTAAAPTVSRSFTVTAVAPGAPTIGTATAGDGQASVAFTAPASDGGTTITSYTVTSSPDAKSATGTTSPITVTGLTNGTAYTFTVTATNGAGTSAASAVSIGVTPIAPQVITFGTLPSQIYGTDFVKLAATASSGLSVGYTSANGAAIRISNDTAFILAADTVAITASQPGSASYQAAASVSQKMTVTRRPMAITGATASNKVYDGTTSADVTGAALSGVVNSDEVSLVLGAASFATRDTGTAKAVTVTGSTLSGAKAGNYNLAEVADLTANVKAKEITVTANAQTKVYGSSDPALTCGVAPSLYSGDAFTGMLSRASGDTVGKYAIVQGTLSVGTNYSLSFLGDSLSITTYPITVTARDTSRRGGMTDPVLPWSATPLLGSDTWSGALTRDAGESDGDYPIRLGTLSAGANYDVTFHGAIFKIRTPSSLSVRPTGKTISHELAVHPVRVIASVALGADKGSLEAGTADENDLSVDVLVPGAASVIISIFDNLGNPVIAWSRDVTASQVRQFASSGDGRAVLPVRWNLRSNNGRPVPSGVYLWKIVVLGADGQKLETVKKTGVR
jgi:hypothetical protein